MNRPLCFVLMPFGQKPDAAGAIVDFDAVYQDLIGPAIKAAGLESLRADEEQTGGIIHKPMFERLIFCEYALADLSTANANVFYELGVRHAIRPWSTVLICSGSSRLPFDVAPLRALPYKLTATGKPDDVSATRKLLVKQLRAARTRQKASPTPDSPLFQLVDGMPTPDIAHLKTDVFRERVDYSTRMKKRLADARARKSVDMLHAVEKELGEIADCEAGVVIDTFLSYRALGRWPEMIALVDKMSRPLAETVMVQEQLAFALNRAGDTVAAERVLQDLLARRGPSSETYGLLGRVYKDRWEAAWDRGEVALADGELEKAIDAYRRGFEADWRDAYPGINAVTLMEIRNPPDPRREQLLPVVAYAVERRIAGTTADYWDHATRLELAVLAKDKPRAEAALADALANIREAWEPESTSRNLRLIRRARDERAEHVPWAQQIEDALDTRARA